MTVGEIVKKNPQTAILFKKLNIDYCCGGNVKIEDACEKKGVDYQSVLSKIELLSQNKTTLGLAFDDMPLDFLVDYIYQIHHTYLYKNLPEIEELVLRVAEKHRDHYSWLPELKDLFLDLQTELMAHLPKEETDLFPYAKRLFREKETHEIAANLSERKSENTISELYDEHDKAGEIIHQMRKITNYYSPPEEACNSVVLMFTMLNELDEDLTQHIHLENNILLPKLVQLENKKALNDF